ncbi:hypothetical protein NCCP2222_19490 [Sporosarcina sp. NCCP-2222]|uniref:DnaD domain-containing protein n=1 Tax=Sporosarcina sp. NCCP-2222 TaxID=2935073 RepID=UPI002083AEC0|nr:DnaD domain protein [Sporosarcina sp. NCCP-2222]GKV56002.1 hypothetical protein NCCP2222_19490 [Sporosarcina sp. NCCP-2222]
MSGAFLMSREIFSHEIWNDVAKFRIFFYIVGNAVFSERGVTKGGIHIGRGQYLRSYRNIREDLLYVEKNAEKYYSLNTIKTKIDELVKEGTLTTEETRLGTLFTVVNYHKYQGFETYKNDSSEQEQNSKRTPKEQQENSNGTPTEQQQNNKNYVINAINVNQDITTTATTAVDRGFGNLVQTFEMNLCMLSPIQIDSLGKWFDDFEQNAGVFTTAIKIAADRNRKNFGFVEYLLKEWSHHKLTTVEQIESHERNKFDKQRQQPRPYNRPGGKVERLPEWFRNKQQETQPEVETEGDVEARRRELEERLENMRRENA